MYNDVRALARLNFHWIHPTDRLVADKIHRYLAALGTSPLSDVSRCHSDISDICRHKRILSSGAAAASFLLKDRGEILFDVTANSISRQEATLINDTEQPPITLVLLISHHITSLKNSGVLDSFHAVAMEQHLSQWQVELGALERILNTPTYTAFTRQTSRFLILWLTFLPFGLAAYLSWACCGCMPVLCFLLVGIDNIASSIENPMTSLPCRALASSQANVVEVIRRTRENPTLTEILNLT